MLKMSGDKTRGGVLCCCPRGGAWQRTTPPGGNVNHRHRHLAAGHSTQAEQYRRRWPFHDTWRGAGEGMGGCQDWPPPTTQQPKWRLQAATESARTSGGGGDGEAPIVMVSLGAHGRVNSGWIGPPQGGW